MYASRNGHESVVRLLLGHDADMNAVTNVSDITSMYLANAVMLLLV